MAKKKKAAPKKKRAASTKVVVVGKHHTARKTRKRSVGAVGKTKHRKKTRKRGFLGATGGTNAKQIGMMALGVAGGAALTHFVLRPVEKRLVEKWPEVAKFIAVLEIGLGGLIALKGKSNVTKSIGVGILAGGVHGAMKQFEVYKNIPGISGSEDGYQSIKIPISGRDDMTRMVAGILQDGRRQVRTKMVAGRQRSSSTAIVADTDFDEAYDFSRPKGRL